MSRVLNSVVEAIGNTPLVRLDRLTRKAGVTGTILAKLEYLNPGFSKKDRAAQGIIAEAERAGLAARVVPHDTLLDEVRKIAAKIASQSPLAVMANKEMVNAALETTLTQGVQFERRLFHSLFAFEDQKEGMAAFVEKRKPVFTGR